MIAIRFAALTKTWMRKKSSFARCLRIPTKDEALNLVKQDQLKVKLNLPQAAEKKSILHRICDERQLWIAYSLKRRLDNEAQDHVKFHQKEENEHTERKILHEYDLEQAHAKKLNDEFNQVQLLWLKREFSERPIFCTTVAIVGSITLIMDVFAWCVVAIIVKTALVKA